MVLLIKNKNETNFEGLAENCAWWKCASNKIYLTQLNYTGLESKWLVDN